MESQNQPLYININAGEEPYEMESFCVNCEKQGTTKLLLTKIPFFKEIVISSFYCEHCGYKNSEIQSGGAIQDHGLKLSLKIIKMEDLSRDIVKSEHAVIRIPELDFEIPSNKKGSLNTIEGILMNVIEELQMNQPQRREIDAEVAQKLDEFIEKVQKLLDGYSFPFTFEIDDASGNSFIKNPYAPNTDPQLKTTKYQRTIAQLNAMGFYPENDNIDENQNLKTFVKQEEEQKVDELQKKIVGSHRIDFNKPLNDDDVRLEAQVFQVPCHACGKEGETKMCTTSVPYFKELIIMSFICEFCGAHSTECKTGGEISPSGKTITLKVEQDIDLKRDCFKSESSILRIPEIDLELDYGTLGGIYSTIEGLLDKIVENLKENNPFVGDSSSTEFKQKLDHFFGQIEKFKNLQEKFTLIFDDPLDNSFIQNPYYPEKDPRIEVEVYQRNEEQNDFFGLNDMKTENY